MWYMTNLWGSGSVNSCSVWRALGDCLDGSYIRSNHKQELSSVYQFIDVLYNLCWVLSSSDDELMEFYDSGY